MIGYLVQTHRFIDNSYRLYGLNNTRTQMKWLTTQYNTEIDISKVLKDNPICFTDKEKAFDWASANFDNPMGIREYKIIEVEI